jgi:hypothetical protein
MNDPASFGLFAQRSMNTPEGTLTSGLGGRKNAYSGIGAECALEGS